MERPFDTVAVIGTGTLGAQIALLAAHAGYRVTIHDTRPGVLRPVYEQLRASVLAKGVTPLVPFERLDEMVGKVREVTSLPEAVRDADFVIEAVPENLELKRKVWAEIGPLAPPHAVFATNSSSIPVSRMEDATGRPEKCLNVHFYFLLEGMNMTDVMGGSRTLPEVLDKGKAWVRTLGCVPLTVNKELLGFCFNRVWRAVKREVLWMWGNNFVDFRDVDRAWMIFTQSKQGPFAMMDTVGLDVIHAIEMVYARDSGDPRDMPPQALQDKIDRGELGVKSGRGFYTYPNPEYQRPDFLKPYRDSD